MDREALIGRFVAWAERETAVRGALIVGSYARRERPADEWSDLDITMFVIDPRVYLDRTGWLASIGEPWLTFLEGTAIGGGQERRVLFADGIDVDFSIFAATEEAAVATASEARVAIHRGARILVDRDGVLSRTLANAFGEPAPSAEAPSQERLTELVHDVLYHAIWAAKKLLRGQTWVATQACNAYLQQHLLQLVEWHARSTVGGVDTWHGSRFLEEWAVPGDVPLLAAALARYDRADVERALFAAVYALGAIGRDTAARLALAYPDEAHARTQAWLRDHLAG